MLNDNNRNDNNRNHTNNDDSRKHPGENATEGSLDAATGQVHR